MSQLHAFFFFFFYFIFPYVPGYCGPPSGYTSQNHGGEIDFNEVKDIPAQGISLIQLALFTEQHEPDDTKFSQFVYERDFVPSIVTGKQEDGPQKLIAVQPKDSEAVKKFNSTQ
ncbi:hypothetical protein EYZ11_010138 [Aspergillus tanneri]|uniref:Uncharacterized protein n=1 Tax=Aspergillus tanneri TaxID=1220188 RepID=A0A4S3J893_9EURO|nr:hypothetical protein EYZ11_010138 [Aspergillus tanneri]